MELPLDGNGIMDLKPGDDEKFQKYAKDLANKKGFSRIHLDLEFWRP
ncbi:MAG: hypothetical protein QMC77_04270 [Methanocellales archaeon]|nr:hypothetical protein [Methanocellales archaeon]